MSYRKIDPRMWDDERFATLSQPTKLVWLLILTGPHTTPLPGLSNVGVAALAESSRYDGDTVSRGLVELSRAGMVEFNPTCRVLRVPNAPKYNPCSNPKVLKGWFSLFKSVPDCAEKFRHLASLRAAIPADEAWADAAWAATFGSVAIPARYAGDTVSHTLTISGSGAVAGASTGTGASGFPAVVADATDAEWSDDPPAKVATKRQPRAAKVAPPVEPLPFTIEVALEAIATASGGKFAIPRGGEFRRQHLSPLTRMIRSIPDLGAWERVGRWLASGVIRRPDLGVAWLIGSDAFALSRQWEETRPPAAPTLFEEHDPIEIARQEYRARLGLAVAS